MSFHARRRGTLPAPRGRRVASYRRPVKRSELVRDLRDVLLQVRPTLAHELPDTLLWLSYRVWIPAMGAAKHAADAAFCYFPARALEAEFGRGKFNHLNEKHNIFEILEADTRPGRWTRGYRLVADIETAVNEYLRRVDERLPVLMTREGARVLTAPAAVASENLNGKAPKAWAGAPLPNRVPIDFELLNTWAEHLRRYINTGGYTVAGAFVPFAPEALESIKGREAVLSRLIALANSTIGQRRCVPIRYQEQPCGRAFATGVSLQNAPSDIRDAALHGNWDLDLSNCHYSLLLQISSIIGVDLPEVRRYLAKKDVVRKGLASRVGVSYDDAKSCLIALIYGARRTLWHEADIPQLLGPSLASKLYSDPQYKALKADVDRARNAILRAARREPLVLTTGAGSTLRVAAVRKLAEERLFNAVGHSIITRETEGRRKGKRRAPAALLAHLLLGLEAKIMRVVVDAYPGDVLLLMHDGLVSRRELPVAETEELIYRHTGLRMGLDQERIEAPEELRDLGNFSASKPLNDMESSATSAHYGSCGRVVGPGVGVVVVGGGSLRG